MKILKSQSSPRGRHLGIVLGLLVIALLIPAGTALAQSDPVDSQYESAVTQVSNNDGGGSSGLETSVVDGLPFTGLDLIALAAVAVALTSVGLALRHMTANRGSASGSTS